jgi:hypothetical protein
MNPFYLRDWGGSGGPSRCATGTPSIAGVVSGTCAGYPKPSWQSGVVGIPSDGVRDLPDVSLFSSFGPWNHSYVICYSDPTPGSGGVPCDGTATPANRPAGCLWLRDRLTCRGSIGRATRRWLPWGPPAAGEVMEETEEGVSERSFGMQCQTMNGASANFALSTRG